MADSDEEGLIDEVEESLNITESSETSNQLSEQEGLPSTSCRRSRTRSRIWRQTAYKALQYQPIPLNSVRAPMQYFQDYFDDDFYQLGAE